MKSATGRVAYSFGRFVGSAFLSSTLVPSKYESDSPWNE
jgi:hypothetical protein